MQQLRPGFPSGLPRKKLNSDLPTAYRKRLENLRLPAIVNNNLMAKAAKIEVWIEIQPGIYAKSPYLKYGYARRPRKIRVKPDKKKRLAQVREAGRRYDAKRRAMREAMKAIAIAACTQGGVQGS